MVKRILLIILVLSSLHSFGQKEKFQINGAARAYIFSNQLNIDEDIDSVTTKNANYGHTLLDLGVSIFPNKKTEVIGMFRIRNELGGFWGGGTSFDVRQLTLKGVAGNVVKYEIGDVDLEMTPYTLFNFQEEGIVNEAEAFRLRRDVVHYDLFYLNNSWRMQGAKTKFGLNFNKGIKGIDITSFITRQRQALETPERLYGGGTISIAQSKKLRIDLNSVSNFDLTKTIVDSTRYRNGVHTVGAIYNLPTKKATSFVISGESGISNAKYVNTTYSERAIDDPAILDPDTIQDWTFNDWFYDVSIQGENKSLGLTYKLGYKDVGADFLSPGAQTQRVNYGRFPGLYQQITNDVVGRKLSYTDVINGNAANSIRISEQLLPYSAAYNNTNPYGQATPNRRGAYASVERVDTTKVRRAFVNVGMFDQGRGTGTESTKTFMLLEAGGDVYVNDFFKWKKELKLNVGVRYEGTKRDGEESEDVDLTSTLIDVGLSYKLAEDLDILAGAKFWAIKGNEFLNERNRFNVITNFEVVEYNFTENTIVGGIKYQFNDKNVLTAQYQIFNLENKIENGIDYGISQLNLLFNMKF